MKIPVVITSQNQVIDSRVQRFLIGLGQPVVHYAMPRRPLCDPGHQARNKDLNIAQGRTIALRMAQADHPDAEYFFFLDDDVLPPENVLWRLWARKLQAVGAWFEARNGGWVGGQMRHDKFEHFQDYRPGLTPTDILSLGCTLVHSSLLVNHTFDAGVDDFVLTTKGDFRHISDSGAFANYLKSRGVQPLLDGSVIAEHLSKGIFVEHNLI